MKKFEDFIKEVERDLVIKLAISNKKKLISFDEAKEIARDFMSSSPFQNYEDMFRKMHALSNKHRLIRTIYVSHAPVYFEAKKDFVLKNFRKALEEKDIDKAISISRKVYYERN